MPYPVPPPAPRQQPDEPRAHYAARLFCLALDDARQMITWPDDVIELAAYGARTATDARGASPQYYDRVADAERAIAGALRRRRALDAEQQPAALDATTIQPSAPGRPTGPAVPVHPYPSTNPPAGQYADQGDHPQPVKGTRTPAGRVIRF